MATLTRILAWVLTGRRPELLVLGLALLVRWVHFVGISSDPLFEVPRMDPRYHDEWATRIVEGEWRSDTPFFRAPFYPYVLAGVYALSDHSIAVAKGVGLLVGALVPFFVVTIGRRIVSTGMALTAGVVMSLYPLALRFDGDLLLEGLFVTLLMLALELEMRALERPSRAGWLMTGVAFGLAVITRPNLLAFVVLIPLAHWLARRGRSDGARFERAFPSVAQPLREALLIALGVCVPIVPVALHNLAAGDFVPIATQAGVNFYIGNNPRADGFTAIVPETRATWWGGHDDAVALASRAVGRELRASEVNDYFLERGLGFIASQPGAAMQLFVRKAYLFWWGAEISNNEHIYFLRRYSIPMQLTLGHLTAGSFGLFVPFGLLAPLGLMGLVFGWRRPRARPLILFVVAYTASVVLFFVCARFRYPIIPVLSLFAVFGLVELVRRRRRSMWALTLVLVLVLNADPYSLRTAVFGAQSLSYLDLGVYHAGRGETAPAIAALENAARLDPGHPGPHLWLGKVYLAAGRVEEAEERLRYTTRGDPVLFRDVVSEAQKELGRIYLQQGRPDEALRTFRAALSLRPDFAHAVLGVGYAMRDMRRPDEARVAFERVLELSPTNRAARAELERLEQQEGGD